MNIWENKEIKTAGTHDGALHADETMGTAIILEVYPNATIARTRSKDILAQCDIVYDVGGGEFDHHSVDKQYRASGVPYASAGLIWKTFGSKMINKIEPGLSIEKVAEVLKEIDTNVMEGIDAVDNGYKVVGETERAYKTVSISAIISGYNPLWNDKETSIRSRFDEAVSFSRAFLIREIKKTISVIEARNLLDKDLENREVPEILVLSAEYPWLKNLLGTEEGNDVLFAVYKSSSSDEYMVQTIKKELGSFETRKDLPENWAGKREGDFNEVTGLTDGIFCHPERFIAGAKSIESCVKLAKMALEK